LSAIPALLSDCLFRGILPECPILNLPMTSSLSLFAATTTTGAVDRLKEIPPEFWYKVGLGILAIIAVVIILRKIARVNKAILGVIVLLTVSFIGFSWIYERNEPAWATPFVERVSHFFPTKGPIRQKDLPK
jgi:hypothetical protein